MTTASAHQQVLKSATIEVDVGSKAGEVHASIVQTENSVFTGRAEITLSTRNFVELIDVTMRELKYRVVPMQGLI